MMERLAMSNIVELLRGSPHTRCRLPGCFGGHQVCPHDDEEIYDAWGRAMADAADEIERLRAALRQIADAYAATEGDENAMWMREMARRALGRQ